MVIRFLILTVLISASTAVAATEKYIMDFTVNQGQKKVEWGKTYITPKIHTWSKGLKRTYLQLRCNQQATGKIQKSLTLVDHFSGVRITHQLVEKQVKITVVRDIVQPRLTEIRALGKDECRDISPGITTTTQSYSFPARSGTSEQRLFGEDLTFQITLQKIGASNKQ